MNKFLLIASTAIIGFIPFSSKAQFLGTGDVARDSTAMLGWIQNAAAWAKDQAAWTKQAQDMFRQYQMMSNTFNAISGARDLGSISAALGSPVRTYLPEASEMVGMVGDGSRLFSSAGNIRSMNQVFNAVPQATRFMGGGGVNERWSGEMERRENTTANIRAMAEAGLADMRDRMSGLQVAQARLAVAQDLQDVESVKGTIEVAQSNLAMHAASFQQMQLMLAAADRTDNTRREQIEAEGASKWAQSTQSAVDMLQGD